jgi:hypothetical protein
LISEHAITGALHHIKCINCGWHTFVDFKSRQPVKSETTNYAQKGIAKSRRTPCLND